MQLAIKSKFEKSDSIALAPFKIINIRFSCPLRIVVETRIKATSSVLRRNIAYKGIYGHRHKAREFTHFHQSLKCSCDM